MGELATPSSNTYVDALLQAIYKGVLDDDLKSIVTACFERRRHMDPKLWPMEQRSAGRPKDTAPPPPKKKLKRKPQVGEAVTPGDVKQAQQPKATTSSTGRERRPAPPDTPFIWKYVNGHMPQRSLKYLQDDQGIHRPILDRNWYRVKPVAPLPEGWNADTDRLHFEHNGRLYDKKLFAGCLISRSTGRMFVIKGIGPKSAALVPLDDTAARPMFIGKNALSDFLG